MSFVYLAIFVRIKLVWYYLKFNAGVKLAKMLMSE